MCGCVVVGWHSAVLAQLSATATISSVPNGGDFDYTIALKNTGGSDIGTFWFAWTRRICRSNMIFFLSAPGAAPGRTRQFGRTQRIRRLPRIQHRELQRKRQQHRAGQTALFTFTSADSPTVLQQSTFRIPNMTSFIYAGFPEEGVTAEVTPVFVTPEPSLLLPTMLTVLAYTATSRERRHAETMNAHTNPRVGGESHF